MNYLVWPEGRKLYAVVRGSVGGSAGGVWNNQKKTFVTYKEEDREKYICPIEFIGGDLYILPKPTSREIMIVYEQQGAKPSNFDAVIEVFGDARFDYQKFSDNAKYSKKQKPQPY